MPRMDGLQVLSIVRRRHPELRTVVLSGLEDEEYRSRAYALGVDLFWIKIEMQRFTVASSQMVADEAFTRMRARGAIAVLHGDSFSDAYQHAMTLVAETGKTYIPPFDDPDVIAGQGTIGMEILRQHSEKIHAIFVAAARERTSRTDDTAIDRRRTPTTPRAAS